MQSPTKSLAEDMDSVEQYICPCCGADLMIQKGFCNVYSSWICKVCGEMLINPEIEDTKYVLQESLTHGKEDYMNTCVCCGCSLKGAVLTLPWEDGDNPYAYVTCPNCGYENIEEGFGEDDD